MSNEGLNSTTANTLTGGNHPRAGARPLLNQEGSPAVGRLYGLMMITTVFWAANIVAAKFALRGFSPMALAQMRVTGTAAIYAVWFVAAGGFARLKLSTRQWLYIIAAALSGVALNQICFVGGLARSTVAHSGLIVALGPVMVLLIAVLARMETLTAWKFLGMLVSFAGVGILTIDRSGPDGGTHWAGDLILLAGTALFAIYTILMKELSEEFDPLTLNTLVFVPSVFFMAPFCVRQALTTPWAAVGWQAWGAWIFMVVCGSVVPYLLFAYVIKHLAASRVAAFNYLQPVIASGLAAFLLAERLSMKVAIGGAMILAGVYLTERERGEEASAAPAVAPPPSKPTLKVERGVAA